MSIAADVLSWKALWSIEKADAIQFLRSLPDDSCDCLVSSPPYLKARTYGRLDVQRNCFEWIDWMLEVCAAAQHAVKGPMFWVVAGQTESRNYQPGPEGLAYLWWRKNGDSQLYRPCIYSRVGIPGSGGEDYLRADWEYVLCMKRPGKLPFFDLTACGHPPKWAPGGEMSHRLSDGSRVNKWGGSGKNTFRMADGSLVRQTGHASRPGEKTKAEVEGTAEPQGESLFDDERTPIVSGNQWGNEGSERGMGGQNADDSLKKKGRPSHKRTNNNLCPKGGNNRTKNGDRKHHTKRVAGADGDEMEDQEYTPPVLANPGNSLKTQFTADEVLGILAAAGMSEETAGQLVHGKVGGGLMGHPLASKNEAPFPLWIAEFFVRSFCPPNGIVLDPFAGSSTTGHACLKWGRRYLGTDIRQSQVDLSTQRLQSQASLFDAISTEES